MRCCSLVLTAALSLLAVCHFCSCAELEMEARAKRQGVMRSLNLRLPRSFRSKATSVSIGGKHKATTSIIDLVTVFFAQVQPLYTWDQHLELLTVIQCDVFRHALVGEQTI